MTVTHRSTRTALIAYALLSVLILGGVTWGTVATLRLEHAEGDLISDNDFREIKNRALDRMDNLLMPILAREAARPYWEYDPYSHPHMYQLDGMQVISDEYIQPSPLIDQPLEPWIRLHFQVDAYGSWQSPQVPTAERFRDGASIAIVDRNDAVRHLIELDRLRASYTYEDLERMFDATGPDWNAGATQDIDQPTRCVASICEKWFNRDRWLRYEQQQQLLSDARPQQICEHSNVALSNLFDQSVYDAEGPGIPITVSSMKPLWLDIEGDERSMLAFVRVVSTDVPGLASVQGFVIDWQDLSDALLADEVIEDLRDVVVDLTPTAVDDFVEDDRKLASLPAAIVAEPPAMNDRPWTSTHWLLVGIWTAALSVLAVVGFGIHNLLSLADRRSQFAYAVTHELRTPLTTLRLYTDMLAGGLVKPEDRDRYVDTLSTESERLSDLVDEVLEYARVENHKVRLDIQTTSVADLLERIRAHCDVRCEKSGKKLVVDVNGLSDETLRTDPNLVRQVLTNLVDNACKHSGGAADPTITLRAHRAGNERIAFDVADRGPGITAAQKHVIFKPFRRPKSSDDRPHTGIGLGLALAKSWAHLLGARLDLVPDSTPGACFRLTIPKSR